MTLPIVVQPPQQLPSPNRPWIDPKTGLPTKELFLYMQNFDAVLRSIVPYVGAAPYQIPTPANAGSIIADPTNGSIQKLSNDVAAFTINAPTTVGVCAIEMTNGAAAGTPTFSGFAKLWAGDALDTVVGHVFVIFIYSFGDEAFYLIKAGQ